MAHFSWIGFGRALLPPMMHKPGAATQVIVVISSKRWESALPMHSMIKQIAGQTRRPA
jgi:hypothetical protein